MIFEKEKTEDWKEFLSEDSKEILAKLFESTKKHRGAYMQAEDVKIAQLWCALTEIRKEMKEMTNLMKRIEEPFKAIVAIGEAEKKRAIQKLITEIIKPEEEEEKEATRRLVESLMKF